jgi:hypothetical protein
LCPLGNVATNRPIVLSPGDYDDGEIGGMMIGRGNQSTRRKPAPVPLSSPQTPHALPGCEPGSPRWEASDYPLELRHGLFNLNKSLHVPCTELLTCNVNITDIGLIVIIFPEYSVPRVNFNVPLCVPH